MSDSSSAPGDPTCSAPIARSSACSTGADSATGRNPHSAVNSVTAQVISGFGQLSR